MTIIDPRLPVFYVFSPTNDEGFGTLDRFFLLGGGASHWSFPAKSNWETLGDFSATSLQGNATLAGIQIEARFPLGRHATVGDIGEVLGTGEGEPTRVNFKGITIRDADDTFRKYGALYACAVAAFAKVP